MRPPFRLIALLLALAAGLPSRGESWRPELDTAPGRFALMEVIVDRHPTMPMRNLLWQRSYELVLADANALHTELGEHAGSWEIGPNRAETMEYIDAKELRHDETRVAEVRKQLTEDRRVLGIDEPRGLAEDLRAVRGDKKRLKALIRLAPFLYGDVTEDQVTSAYRPALATYAGKFRAEGRDVADVVQSVENQFVRRLLEPALQRVPVRGTASRALTLETVPPLVALFRGNFAKDCSMMSVPNYVLVKGVKTYWVHTQRGAREPDGYVIAVPVQIEGKMYPYVLSVNGENLGEEQVRVITKLVARDWKTDRVVVPDLAKNPHVVNSDEVRRGMAWRESRDVEVTLPPGWAKVDEASVRNPPPGYDMYYLTDRIKGARLARITDEELPPAVSVSSSTVNRYPRESVGERARMLVAAQALRHDPATPSALRGRSEVQLAARILGAGFLEPIAADDFRRARHLFGMRAEDLLAYDAYIRAPSLASIHRGAPDLFTPAEWDWLVEKTNDRLSEVLPYFLDNPWELHMVVSGKLQMPRVHNARGPADIAHLLTGEKTDDFKLRILIAMDKEPVAHPALRDALGRLLRPGVPDRLRSRAVGLLIDDATRDATYVAAIVEGLTIPGAAAAVIYHMSEEQLAVPIVQKGALGAWRSGEALAVDTFQNFLSGVRMHDIADYAEVARLARRAPHALNKFFAGAFLRDERVDEETRERAVLELETSLDRETSLTLLRALRDFPIHRDGIAGILGRFLKSTDGEIRDLARASLHDMVARAAPERQRAAARALYAELPSLAARLGALAAARGKRAVAELPAEMRAVLIAVGAHLPAAEATRTAEARGLTREMRRELYDIAATAPPSGCRAWWRGLWRAKLQ